MNFKQLTIAAIGAAMLAAPIAQAKDMEIVVWAAADQNERYRFEAVQLAANVLNEELKIAI
jgi:hypothetical protein